MKEKAEAQKLLKDNAVAQCLQDGEEQLSASQVKTGKNSDAAMKNLLDNPSIQNALRKASSAKKSNAS